MRIYLLVMMKTTKWNSNSRCVAGCVCMCVFYFCYYFLRSHFQSCTLAHSHTQRKCGESRKLFRNSRHFRKEKKEEIIGIELFNQMVASDRASESANERKTQFPTNYLTFLFQRDDKICDACYGFFHFCIVFICWLWVRHCSLRLKR